MAHVSDHSMLVCIRCALIFFAHSFEIYPETKYGVALPIFLVGYSAFVTYSYIIINNPVYHQVCYALLVFTVVFRSIYVCRQITGPFKEYERPRMEFLLWIAASSFLGAFIVWNIDNQFCSFLRNWRDIVGLPLAALSEVWQGTTVDFHIWN